MMRLGLSKENPGLTLFCAIGSIFIILLGLTVLFGWIFDLPILVQIYSDLVPMQFNAGVSFTLIGFALLLSSTTVNKSLSILISSIVLLISLLTLIQYFAGIDLLIDEIFFKHPIVMKTSNPGRMAPNTALCFLLSGTFIVAYNSFTHERLKTGLAVIFGSAIFVLGSFAIIGYISGNESAYGWYNFTRMALHTALGFIVVGVVILVHSLKKIEDRLFIILIVTGVLLPLLSIAIETIITSEILYENISLHATVETTSAVISIISGVFLILRGKKIYLDIWFLAGCGLLFLGIFDVIHSALPSGFRFVWTHSFAFFVSGLFILLGSLSSKSKKLQNIHWVLPSIFLIVLMAFIGFSFLLLLNDSIASASDIISETSYNNMELVNVVGGVLYLIACGFFIRLYLQKKEPFIIVFSFFTLLLGISGITFSFSHLWCPTWWLWHFYKAVAYLVLLIFLFTVEQRNQKELSFLNEKLADQMNLLNQANQEMIKSNEKLLATNKELDEFTYIASHDLQEPLRKLNSFSTLLEKDVGENLNEDARKDLLYIMDASKRMQLMVKDLLVLSRTSRFELNTTSIDLDECLDEALYSLEIRIKESKASILRSPLPKLSADKTLVYQLYLNLIGNALKYIPPNRTPAIEITAERIKDHLILGVKDNGIGIEEKYFKKIFEPFRRLFGKAEYEGNGIGLSICKKIVERHNGKIWVESQLGVGTHFRFTLYSLSSETRKELVTQ